MCLRLRDFWQAAGLWPRSQRLGLEAASRRPDASPRSRLGLGLRCLGLKNKNLARAETRPTRRTLRAQVPACTLWPVCQTKF